MSIETLREQVLRQHGLRLEPAMGEYLARKLSDGKAIPVIGGDARTGTPVQQSIDPSSLSGEHFNKLS